MVETFFCFSLEFTANEYGTLGIIGSFILIIFSIAGIVHAQDVVIMLQRRGLDLSKDETELRLYIATITLIIGFAASICLILGNVKKRHNLVLVWLISTPWAIAVLCYFLVLIRHKKFISLFVTYVYLWIAMRSLYKRIKSERQTRFSGPVQFMPKQMA